MKNLTLALYFFFMASTMYGQTSLKDEQHRATFTIILANNDKHSIAGCSATAISEHVLLTAEHCDIEDGLLYLNQTGKPLQNPVTIAQKYYDHMDHMLLVTPGVEYKHTVDYSPEKYKPLLPGEHIYLWGNPGFIRDQYREGYVSGQFKPSIEERDLEIDAGGPITMFAMPVVGGDSGSAVFSAEDGRLVGVTTYNVLDKFLGTYPLQFTEADVQQAEGRGNVIYLLDTRPNVKITINAPAPEIASQISSISNYLGILVQLTFCVVLWIIIPFRRIFAVCVKSLRWVVKRSHTLYRKSIEVVINRKNKL
jgi:hypothetical protein